MQHRPRPRRQIHHRRSTGLQTLNLQGILLLCHHHSLNPPPNNIPSPLLTQRSQRVGDLIATHQAGGLEGPSQSGSRCGYAELAADQDRLEQWLQSVGCVEHSKGCLHGADRPMRKQLIVSLQDLWQHHPVPPILRRSKMNLLKQAQTCDYQLSNAQAVRSLQLLSAVVGQPNRKSIRTDTLRHSPGKQLRCIGPLHPTL
mmetsp:Transcript_105272/g.241369  ORF Transcript_105272/g.241369 Transcript_105272/m.241369 type:complete len:200 (-) Transcript_105272:450-1049(-)